MNRLFSTIAVLAMSCSLLSCVTRIPSGRTGVDYVALNKQEEHKQLVATIIRDAHALHITETVKRDEKMSYLCLRNESWDPTLARWARVETWYTKKPNGQGISPAPPPRWVNIHIVDKTGRVLLSLNYSDIRGYYYFEQADAKMPEGWMFYDALKLNPRYPRLKPFSWEKSWGQK